MKPVFLTGTCITAITFIGTIYTVHVSRYDRRVYGHHLNDSRGTKISSTISLFCGVISGLALILMGVFDTYRFHMIHGFVLLMYFGGLGICAIGTTIVWFDQVRKPISFPGLRPWCVFLVYIASIWLMKIKVYCSYRDRDC
jgi:hypothetical protein